MTENVNILVLDGKRVCPEHSDIVCIMCAKFYNAIIFVFVCVLFCKCVQGLCYYLRLFGNVFEVCVGIPVYLQMVWWFLIEFFVRSANRS